MVQNFEKSIFLKKSKKIMMFFHLNYEHGTFLSSFRVSRAKRSHGDLRELWIPPGGLALSSLLKHISISMDLDAHFRGGKTPLTIWSGVPVVIGSLDFMKILENPRKFLILDEIQYFRHFGDM